jgi:hypothetical protein
VERESEREIEMMMTARADRSVPDIDIVVSRFVFEDLQKVSTQNCFKGRGQCGKA